jgi:hypothetical protein
VDVGLQTGLRDEHIHPSGKEECGLAALSRSTMKIVATEPKWEPVLNLHKDSTDVDSRVGFCPSRVARPIQSDGSTWV